MPCKILKFDWTAAQTAWLQKQSYPASCELLAVRHPYAVACASTQDEQRMNEEEKKLTNQLELSVDLKALMWLPCL